MSGNDKTNQLKSLIGVKQDDNNNNNNNNSSSSSAVREGLPSVKHRSVNGSGNGSGNANRSVPHQPRALQQQQQGSYQQQEQQQTSKHHHTSYSQVSHRQQLLSEGLQQHFGVVVNVKADFGFIKPLHQPDLIFFRFRDVILASPKNNNNNNNTSATTTATEIKEGDEVSFLVIKENSKGKLCDRGIFLEKLPRGTVQLETTVVAGVVGVVIVEPTTTATGAATKELPGRVRLLSPVLKSASVDIGYDRQEIRTVELWQRCLVGNNNSTLLLRVGDRIKLDVQRYIPENVIFARNVSVVEFVALRQETGRVKSVKEELGYGFLRSVFRSTDIYFRTSDIIVNNNNNNNNGSNGNGNSNKIQAGDLVEFEVDYDDTPHSRQQQQNGNNNNEIRLKAYRIRLLPKSKQIHQANNNNNNGTDNSEYRIYQDLTLSPLLPTTTTTTTTPALLTGLVVRMNERNERSDPLKINGQIAITFPTTTTTTGSSSSSLLLPKEWLECVSLLELATEVVSVVVPASTPLHLQLCKRVLDETNSNYTCDLLLNNNNNNNSETVSFRVWRMSDAEKEARVGLRSYLTDNNNNNKRAHFSFADVRLNSAAVAVAADGDGEEEKLLEVTRVLLLLLPSLSLQGLNVQFHLNYDRTENKLIATNVQLHHQQQQQQQQQEQVTVIGRVEGVRKVLSGAVTISFIRDLSNHQLIFHFHNNNNNNGNNNNNNNVVGSIVECKTALWAGKLLVATNIKSITTTAAATTTTVSKAIGVVVDENSLIYIDDVATTASSSSTTTLANIFGSHRSGSEWLASAIAATTTTAAATTTTTPTKLTNSTGRHNNNNNNNGKLSQAKSEELIVQLLTTLLKFNNNSDNNNNNNNNTEELTVSSKNKALKLPLNVRTPLPFNSNNNNNNNTSNNNSNDSKFEVGDVVLFDAAIDSNNNILISNVQHLNNNNNKLKVQRVKGVVSRLVNATTTDVDSTIHSLLTATATTTKASSSSSSSSLLLLSQVLCELRLLDPSTSSLAVTMAMASLEATTTTTSTPTATTSGEVYVCDLAEVSSIEATTDQQQQQQQQHSVKPGVKVGDVIEFFAIDIDANNNNNNNSDGAVRISGIAIQPILVPKPVVVVSSSNGAPSTVDGITFKPRSAIVNNNNNNSNGSNNSAAANTRVAPLGGATMAQGPPDDTNIVGFPANWRSMLNKISTVTTTVLVDGDNGNNNIINNVNNELEEIRQLPWAHLLTHLFQNNNNKL